jgi:TP901 family phage tail tape measure protein
MANKSVGLLTIAFGADLRGFKKSMQKAQKSIKKFGSSMKSMGKSMTTNLTMPLLAVGAAGVKLAVDFGSSMTKIRTLVGASAKELKSYEKSVLELSNTTGVAADELAQGLFFITSAGLSGQAAIDALEVSAKGAAMGMGEMADIGNALTSIMTAYADEGMTAAMGGDLLHETLKQGKFEAGEFMKKLGTVIPTAAAAGVSFEELGAASATMSKLSGDASGTLTSMNSLMMKLLNPSKQQKDILEEIGISSAELGKMMDDSLMGTLQFLFKNLEGNNEMLMKVFGSSKAVTGALATMGLQSETYKEVLDGMNQSQGNVSEGMKILANDAGFKMKKALNSTKLILMDIGDKVMPLVLKAVEKVQAGMQWWQSLDESVKNTAISIGIFLAALGPTIALIGSLATAFAFLISPIGLVIASIVGIVVAFAYVSENWEAFKERLGDWGWWKNALIQALQWVIEYSPISLLIKGFNKLNTFLGKEPIENPFETMADGLEDLMVETQEYENEFGSFGDTIEAKAEDIFNVFQKLGKSLGIGSSRSGGDDGGVKSSGDDGGVPFMSVINPQKFIGPMNQIGETIKKLTQKQLEYNAAITKFEGIMSAAMTSAAHSTENFFKGFIESIKQSIKQLLIQLAVSIAIKSLFGFDTTKFSSAFEAAKAGVLGFAEGGLVTGPTMALVGEGVGTSASNPEVVAPLDRLKSMINGGGSQQVEVYGRISGNDIFISNQKSTNSRFRSV